MFKKLYWFLFQYDLNELMATPATGAGESFKKKLTKDIAGLVLISYCFLIFSPLLPVLADAMAHTFWKKEHLATVHKDGGKNHVHFELANAAKQAEKGKTTGTFKFGSEDYVHIAAATSFNFSRNFIIEQICFWYRFDYPVPHPDDNFRPPPIA